MADLIADDLVALDRGRQFLRLVLSGGKNLLYCTILWHLGEQLERKWYVRSGH